MALAALGALGAAFAAEWWGGLVPCALCLVERWPYRILAMLGVAALFVPSRALFALMLLAALAGVASAVVHVGVEQGAWPSPLPECAAPRLSGSIAERLAAMPATPSKPCDEPTYLVPAVPVSMAGLNLLLALALSAAVAMSLATRRRRAR